MPATDANFANLIGSRICHDLISPIGAINNGVELLSMSPGAASAELDLIAESADNASARIRFFRIAFGEAGEQMIGASEITSILRAVYEDTRLSVTWSQSTPKSRSMVRLGFLALQCLESALPYGGKIEITEHDGDWTLFAKADKTMVVEGLWNMLSGTEDYAALTPSQVQFGLLPTTAEGLQRRVKSQQTAETISITY